MTDNTQPEALDLADWLEAVGGGPSAKRCAALLREQHARIAELEAQLASIGAGGATGPLIGQPQAMPDLSALTERGAKAWAGVDAQALREGRWYMVTHDGMATLCTDREDAEKEAKDADMAWPHSGPHRAVQLVEASMAGYTAADMATAAAQGFRDGVASLSANAGEPVAFLVCTEEGDPDMVFLDRLEACQYCEDDDPPKPLYLAAPPTAQAEGWRLVPVDATEEMVRATDKVNFANADTDGTMHNVWNVMLAAAPQHSPTAQAAPAGANVRRSDLVPGVMHCAKCKFQLNRVTLCVSDGNAYAGDNKTEPCPNGCGPLWPVTWEQEARNCWKALEEMHERLQAAPAAGAVAGPSRFADVIAVRRSEAEADTSDAYMVGLYNGMSMMDANYRNITDWEPMLTAPRPCPTPPTQAQAGAVPLTNARLQDISLNYSDSEDECTGFRDGWRAAEKHHGIKGGQHVGKVD